MCLHFYLKVHYVVFNLLLKPAGGDNDDLAKNHQALKLEFLEHFTCVHLY